MGIAAAKDNAVAAEFGVLWELVCVLHAAIGIGSQETRFVNFSTIGGVDVDCVLIPCIRRNILKLVACLTIPELTKYFLLRLIDRSVSDTECFCIAECAMIANVGMDSSKTKERLPLV